MKATNKSLGGGAVLAAVVASLCCIIPILFAGAGAAAIVLAGKFAAIRPYLLVVTGLLLLAGFYFAYRPTNATCEPGPSCATLGNRGARLGLWLATAFAVVLTTIPYWSAALIRNTATKLDAAAIQVSGLPLQKTRLHISGMFCDGCAAGIENALRAQRGVRSASVVFSKSEAEVEYDPSQVSLLQIQALIEKEGYQVTGVLPPSGREG